MPILKAIGNNKSNKKTKQTPSSLKRVLNYITRNNKDEKEKNNEVYKVFGIGLSDDINRAFRQIMFNKNSFNQLEGKQYRHYVIAYEKGFDNLKVIEKIAKEFAEKNFLDRGFKCYVAIHKDKEHYHFHLVVDSVNFLNGFKLQELNSTNIKRDRYINKELKNYQVVLEDLKTSMEEINLKYGIESPSRNKAKDKSINIANMSKYKGITKENSFKTNIAKIWEEIVLEPTTNKENLREKLKTKGVIINRINEENKYLSLKMEYQENGVTKIGKVRLSTLAKDEDYRFQATENVYNWDFVFDKLEKNLEKEKNIANFKEIFKKKEKELLLEKEMVKEIEEYKKDIKQDLEFLKDNKYYVKTAMKKFSSHENKTFEEFSSKLIKFNSAEDKTIKEQYEELKELRKNNIYSLYFKPIVKEAVSLEFSDYLAERERRKAEEEKAKAERIAREKKAREEEEKQKAIENAKQQTPVPVVEKKKLTAVEMAIIEQKKEEERLAKEREEEEKNKKVVKTFYVVEKKKDKGMEME